MNTKPKLGVLGLMLEDYLPLFPGIEEAQAQFVRKTLDSLSDVADFSFPMVALNRERTEALVRQFNADQLDGILIIPLTYSQGQYLVHAMQDNRLPVALTLVQQEQTVRRDFIEWDYTVNQGIHGSQDNINCLLRAGIQPSIFAGCPEDAAFHQFVADFAAAAHTAHAMRSMKISVIGKLTGMGDVVTDDMAIYRKLGPELVYDCIGKLANYCAAVCPEQIAERMAYERSVFEMDPTLTEAQHAEAVRMYLGTKAFLDDGGYSGYTLHYGQCGEDGRFSQLPLLAASDLMADGYGYAAEGDAPAALWMSAMFCLCGQANFSEMYIMDFARNALLLCHQGEGNWKTCRKDRKPYLKNRELSEGGLSNPPTPIFTPTPGRAALCSLVHLGGDSFRLIYAPGEILDEEGLEHVDMPYLFFRPDSGIRPCVEGWLNNGGTHHEVVVFGDPLARIQLLCKMLGIELQIL